MKRLCLPGLLGLLLAAGCGSSGGTMDAGAGGGGGSGGGSACDGAAKNPPNLVPNAGFECGDMGWAPQMGTLDVVTDARSGSKAVKLTASSSGAGVFAYATPILSPAPGDNYCATAWVKGTVGNAKLSILTNNNGVQTDTTFSSPVATSTWIRIPPSLVLEVPDAKGTKVYVRLLLSQGAAGDTLLVDDVDVWESPDGGCKETR